MLVSAVTERICRTESAVRISVRFGIVEGGQSVINELFGAVLDGIVQNLPTAVIMAGATAVVTLITRRQSRKRKIGRNGDVDDGTPEA